MALNLPRLPMPSSGKEPPSLKKTFGKPLLGLKGKNTRISRIAPTKSKIATPRDLIFGYKGRELPGRASGIGSDKEHQRRPSPGDLLFGYKSPGQKGKKVENIGILGNFKVKKHGGKEYHFKKDIGRKMKDPHFRSGIFGKAKLSQNIIKTSADKDKILNEVYRRIGTGEYLSEQERRKLAIGFKKMQRKKGYDKEIGKLGETILGKPKR